MEIKNCAAEVEHRIFRAALEFCGIDKGIELHSSVDVPAGCGLGTSSSFTVALLNVLHAYKQEFVTQKQLAEEACYIEIDLLGEPIGKQDQYMAAIGGLVCLTFEKNGEVLVEPLRISPEMLDLLVVVLALVIYFFPSNVLRIILGIPFVLFFPGYVLTLALYPRKSGLGDIARVVLSLTLSIAVVMFIGLILNYIVWGIRMESMMYSNVAFIFIMSVIAWLRRRRLPEDELFNIGFTLMLPS